MNIRIVAAFACTWCLACGPKNAAPSTVEPTAVSQDAGSSEDADLDAGEDLDEDETLDEEQETEEAAEADAGVDPDGEITFKLHNLCKRAMKYGLGPLERETEILDPKTIKAGGVEEITAPYGIAVHLGEGDTYAAAATKANGGHVWISSSCKGMGSSDDPNADPKKLDREFRERIERMTKGSE